MSKFILSFTMAISILALYTMNSFSHTYLAPPLVRDPSLVNEFAVNREAIERTGAALRSFRHGNGNLFDVFDSLANLGQLLLNEIYYTYVLEDVLHEPEGNVYRRLFNEMSGNQLARLFQIESSGREASKSGRLTIEDAETYILGLEEIIQVLQDGVISITRLRNDFMRFSPHEASLKDVVEIKFDKALQYADQSIKSIQSRVELARGIRSSERCNIHEIITELCAQRTRVKVVNTIVKSIEVVGNKLSFTNALANIIDNAEYYAEKKGLLVAEVSVIVTEEQGMVHIDIIDNGEGIPQDLLDFDTLTERQYVFNLNVSQREGGSGIGTTEAWYTIHDMGGSISVESTRGIGTRFSINHLLIADTVTRAYPLRRIPALLLISH